MLSQPFGLKNTCVKYQSQGFRPTDGGRALNKPSPEVPATNWSVWRTDDTGNTFLVHSGLTREEADRLVAEFEARGHKQTYSAEPDRAAADQ
jgi:hypothetical protein